MVSSPPPFDGSEGRGGAPFDAQGQDPLGGISGIEHGSLGEKPEYTPRQGTKPTADGIASASSGVIIIEIQRQNAAAHKASDENKCLVHFKFGA